MFFFHLQVVSNAIGFLASASERSNYKYLFEKQETLKSICENVVVPNIEFRGSSLSLNLFQYLLFDLFDFFVHNFIIIITAMKRGRYR